MTLEPRWISADDAARYVGMAGTEGFRRAVRRGTMPAPTYALGKQSPRWDRLALDRAMGAGDAGDDMGEAIHALADQIKAEGQGRPQKARGRHDSHI